MSSPLYSLKKSKRPPLFLPEMSTPTPIPSNESQSPTDKFLRDSVDTSSRFNSGYPKIKTPTQTTNSNEHIFSLSRNNYLGEIPSSRVPFKTKIDDSDLIDEATTQMAVNNLKRNVSTNKSINKNAPNDMELMQIMMSKIKQTEARCAIFEKESREKDKKIKILEEKLALYQRVSKSPTRDELVKELEEKNLKLEKQIDEMESFLADYGLRWIGDLNDSQLSYLDKEEDLVKNKQQNQINLSSNIDEFVCKYDLIVKNVKELNSLVETNETKIVEFNDNKAKFETSESIKLTLYSNGIALYNGPFRSFNDSLTKKFCIDIIEGFFPSELQEKFPDGVRFDLIDKRDIYYKEEKNSVFKTKGYRLGSGRISSNDVISNNNNNYNNNEKIVNNKSTLTDENTSNDTEIDYKNIETQISATQLTVEQFLNKLPNCIVRNGKLLDIRNDLSNLIKGVDDNLANKQEETILLNENENKNENEKNQESLIVKSDEAKITTLKIKSLNGENTFLVKMKYSDTIQNLKDHIKSQKKLKFAYKDFDLASVYPRKIFDNTRLTLEQCDLVPNSNIILIPRKK